MKTLTTILLPIATNLVVAGEYHTHPVEINVQPSEVVIQPYETHTETIIEKTTAIERVEGTALGIAHSQLQFDKNISGLQFGIGGGFYDNQEAVAFGLAKQIKEKTILNFSVGSEGKRSSFGIGFNTSW